MTPVVLFKYLNCAVNKNNTGQTTNINYSKNCIIILMMTLLVHGANLWKQSHAT